MSVISGFRNDAGERPFRPLHDRAIGTDERQEMALAFCLPSRSVRQVDRPPRGLTISPGRDGTPRGGSKPFDSLHALKVSGVGLPERSVSVYGRTRWRATRSSNATNPRTGSAPRLNALADRGGGSEGNRAGPHSYGPFCASRISSMAAHFRSIPSSSFCGHEKSPDLRGIPLVDRRPTIGWGCPDPRPPA